MMLALFIVMQTIIFGIVLFFLKKILSGDTDNAVKRLQVSYEEIKKKKEELARKLLDLEDDYREKKEDAEKIGQQIKEQAHGEAYQIVQEAFKKAKVESEDIINKAHKTVAKMRDDITKEMEIRTVEFCGDLLKNYFSHLVRDEVHLALFEEFMSELLTADMSGIKIDSGAEVAVYCSKSLTEEQHGKISKLLKDKLRKEVLLKEVIDEKLIGGVLMKFDTIVLDGSLSGRINEAVVEQKQKIVTRR